MGYDHAIDSKTRRNTLVYEVTRVEDLGGCFDLSAFPLPMRIGLWQPDACHCWTCQHDALHVYMWVLPRGPDELAGVKRDHRGMIDLNTCTEVTQHRLDLDGPMKCIERVRGKIQDMVMHEVYEALLFRGCRIMDPHDYRLKPDGQPF